MWYSKDPFLHIVPSPPPPHPLHGRIIIGLSYLVIKLLKLK